MKVVGLTGGICCGKTIVSLMFRDLGAATIDADQVAHDVIAPNTEGLTEVVERFGNGILQLDGTVDREQLAKLVFSDAKKRQMLEEIVHPRVFITITQWIQHQRYIGTPLAILEIPLLFEAPSPFQLDAAIAVWVNKRTQLIRLKRRSYYDDQTIEGILSAQMDPEKKAGMADYVIDNNASLKRTRRQVEQIYQILVST